MAGDVVTLVLCMALVAALAAGAAARWQRRRRAPNDLFAAAIAALARTTARARAVGIAERDQRRTR